MIQTCEGFYTSQVVIWDFFHQQYFSLEPKTYFGDRQLYTFYTASPFVSAKQTWHSNTVTDLSPSLTYLVSWPHTFGVQQGEIEETIGVATLHGLFLGTAAQQQQRWCYVVLCKQRIKLTWISWSYVWSSGLKLWWKNSVVSDSLNPGLCACFNPWLVWLEHHV